MIKCVAVITIAAHFSCSNDLKSLQGLNIKQKFPQTQMTDFQLIHTDSANVVAILKSKRNDDFSNQAFPFYEFPIGLKVDFFDKKKNKNTVSAKYGILYSQTQLVELRDSVVLTTFDGKKLLTSQLFWDQKQDWIFTEKEFSFIDSLKGTITKGVGMDFNKAFSAVKAHKTTGILAIEDTQ